ncbi:PREDICTED: probable NAD(P)H dehydrogenase (quinone) FQR1-like 3 isoform X1 [Theobroma cacao]|uniref:NAD(P)H dehydrogenase (quinone) n=1 Tax=Theobroma cacao TaxID=3641 RepID=A0AB32WV36_THECC|nr:PREDICTED: probable NAD(P)H dehydrogenase (quinone) FQR1-like 3 isoform X1 [Theobroma cacao]
MICHVKKRLSDYSYVFFEDKPKPQKHHLSVSPGSRHSFFLLRFCNKVSFNIRRVIEISIQHKQLVNRDQMSSPVAAMATTKLYIVYYSLYGHVETMAREVQRGANAVQGVEATLWQVVLLRLGCIQQVPETLSSVILQKMKAPGKANDVPEIRPEQLIDADGFLFGFPSRFGVMAAQFKAFFDASHELWECQALAGKPAGIFWSTGFHGGGQELTALTAVTQLAHHGMIFVPLGYTFGSGMFEMNEVKGGSSYGAGTYAADGSREPTELELQQAFHQGKYVAEITKKLKNKPLSA